METRIKLLNKICREIGLERAQPQNQYLSRRELEYMLGWIRGKKEKREQS